MFVAARGFSSRPPTGPHVSELLQSVVGVVSAHPYLFLFFGLLFAGETVLLPASYLAVTGRLALGAVVLIAIASTLLSDLVWYALGRWFPQTALQRLPSPGVSAVVDGLARLFERRGPTVVFLSKFVYGTRLAAQILAGVHDMPLRRYLVANALGVTTITLVLVGIAWSVAGAARLNPDAEHATTIAFIVFVAIAVLGFFIAARFARRAWSQ